MSGRCSPPLVLAALCLMVERPDTCALADDLEEEGAGMLVTGRLRTFEL